MVYNSFNFLILYPLIFLLYYVIPAKYKKMRDLYLLIVSYSLYISWKPIYAFILLGVTVSSYITAIQIEKAKRPKPVMQIGIIITLLPLLFFKYFNFINDQIVGFLGLFGWHIQLPGLNWAIPIGISFFTFQSMGYIWDVYYKKTTSEKDFLTYALFISFFPSLLMGPINKASLVIPQIKNMRPYFDYPKAVEGLRMILWGMFMKVVVADRVAIYVNTVLNSYENYTGTTCALAMFLYSIQIYADFGGYSLMALGVGKTLGFELTPNFRRPIFAFSVSDYWRRWHLSFCTWLREYVYFPLGGSRCSKLKNYRNILLTFLVSGIWHGANWTFITWGCLHGIFITTERILDQQKNHYGPLGTAIKTVIAFIMVTFTRIFFRMPSLSDACGLLGRICDFSLPKTVYLGTMWSFIIIAVSILFFKDFKDEFFPERLAFVHNKRRWVRWCSYVSIVWLIMLAGVFGADQFIYANF